MVSKVCERCKKIFLTHDLDQKNCVNHYGYDIPYHPQLTQKKRKIRTAKSCAIEMTCIECSKVYLSSFRKGIFCSDECNNIFTSRQKEDYYIDDNEVVDVDQKIISKNCLFCKKDYQTYDNENNFCSDDCLHNYINNKKAKQQKGIITYNNICKICGKSFNSPYSANKLCSRKCQNKNLKISEKVKSKIGLERIEFIEMFVEQLINKADEGGEINQHGAYINYYYIDGFSESIKSRILLRDSFECSICKSKRSLHIHHIIPRILGGTHNENNLITLCFL